MLWSSPKVAALSHLVDDEQVAPLAGELGPAVLEHRSLVVAGLGGEADDDGRGLVAAGGDQPGEDVGVADQLDRGRGIGLGRGSCDFLILARAYSAGRKSATAAAITTTSAVLAPR